MTGETFGYLFGVIFFAVSAAICFTKYARDPFRSRTNIVFGCIFAVGALICAALTVGYGIFPETTKEFMTSLLGNAVMWLCVYIVAGATTAAVAIIMFIRARKEKNGECFDRRSGSIGCLCVFVTAMCVINGTQAFMSVMNTNVSLTDTPAITAEE